MLIKYSGKYVKIYFNMKITFFPVFLHLNFSFLQSRVLIICPLLHQFCCVGDLLRCYFLSSELAVGKMPCTLDSVQESQVRSTFDFVCV